MKSRIGAAVDLETKARARARGSASIDSGFDAAAVAPNAVPAGGLTPTWRMAWSAYGVAFVAVLALFWPTVASLGAIYLGDATFNHGFLILPIVAYLIWLRREVLLQLEPRPTAWALAPLAVAGLGWLAGEAGGVDLVKHFALVGILWSLFLGVFGWRVVRALAFPLFYAVFAVPFGDFLVAPLQDLTAVMAVKGIELVNIPVYSDGLLISIPPGNFEVAEACAGLRFLIATIALGFLFSYLTYKSVWRRAAFLALCVVVPIVANGIRAWGIVFIGYESDMQAAVGFDHIVYGWIFFAIVTAVLLAIGMSFRDQPIGEVPGAPVEPDRRAPSSRAHIAAAAAGLTVACAAIPAYAALVINTAPSTIPIALAAPVVGNGWQLLQRDDDDWKPTFPTADATLLRTYVKGGRAVHLFIAYYRTQDDGHEVVNYVNRVYNEKSWMRVGSGKVVATIEGKPITIEYTRLLHGRAGRIVWGWNWVADRYTSNPYLAKFLQAEAKLFGGRRAAAHIAVAADYGESPSEAVPVLQDFLRSVAPLGPLLARASDH
jgi:exosortase A